VSKGSQKPPDQDSPPTEGGLESDFDDRVDQDPPDVFEYDESDYLKDNSQVADSEVPAVEPSTQKVTFTLDLENDWYFDEPGFDHLTFEYLDDFIALVDEIGVPLTIFVVGKTIEKYPEEIDRLQSELDCEFHLHSYQHDISKDYEFRTELQLGKNAFREHFGRDPIGYRAPQGNIEPTEFQILEKEGFEFDSSVFPSYRPGVYSNLDAPLKPYIPDNVDSLLEIPLGAFRGTRIPCSHSYFKLFGFPLVRALSVAPLPSTLVYNLHLQDLYHTDSHDNLDTPKRWIMKRNLSRSKEMLERNVSQILSRGYEPVKMTKVYNEWR